MKTVKLKNHIFVNGFTQALNRLLEQPMSPLNGFRLSKFAKKVAENEKFFLEQKEKLIKKYGVEDKENKGVYTFADENKDKLNADWKELLNIEVEYKFEPIEVREEASLKTTDIMMLEDILSV
jgi:hypothetical protein